MLCARLGKSWERERERREREKREREREREKREREREAGFTKRERLPSEAS